MKLSKGDIINIVLSLSVFIFWLVVDQKNTFEYQIFKICVMVWLVVYTINFCSQYKPSRWLTSILVALLVMCALDLFYWSVQ